MSLETWNPPLRCPLDGAPLRAEGRRLSCSSGHVYPVVDTIARLLPPGSVEGRDAQWQRFYDGVAPLFDFSERLGSRLLLGIDMCAERAELVRRLSLSPGMRLLEVSPGPGVYQGLLVEAVGSSGELAEVDLSLGMLRACARRARRAGLTPLLVQANAASLPFADAAFDAVFHFGGVKLFSDPARALREMVRVARPMESSPGETKASGSRWLGAGAPDCSRG